MGQRAARRYAQAIISLAQEQNSTDKILEQTQYIQDTLDKSDDLNNVLSSPVIKNADKLEITKEVFKTSDHMLLNLFSVLAINNRFDHLGWICQYYNHLYNQLHNIQEAHITSAIELDNESLNTLKQKIKTITGNDAKVSTEIDEALIGGFILQLNDLQYDASISGKLHKVKRNL